MDSDNVITCKEDIAVTNSYFCSLCTELASKFDHSSNPLLSGDYHDKSMINLKNIILGLLAYKMSGTHSLRQNMKELWERKNILFLFESCSPVH